MSASAIFLIIVLVVLFQNIGKLLCLKIFRTNLKEIRKQWHWKRYVYEFSGSIFLFLLAFAIYSSMMISDEKVYLANDDLIYGIEVSEDGAAIGFKDGDKILSINGKKLKQFRSIIIYRDILKNENPTIEIDRNGTLIKLKISHKQKKMLVTSLSRNDFIKPKFPDKLSLTHENYSISEIVTRFSNSFIFSKEYATKLVTGIWTINGYKRIISPLEIINLNTFRSSLAAFYFFAFIIIIINLIPLPGLDAGNTIIALLEAKRGKTYAAKTLFKLRLLGITSLIVWILIVEFLL